MGTSEYPITDISFAKTPVLEHLNMSFPRFPCGGWVGTQYQSNFKSAEIKNGVMSFNLDHPISTKNGKLFSEIFPETAHLEKRQYSDYMKEKRRAQKKKML